MQTFKQFLAESRTKVVDVEEFIAWADHAAPNYLKGDSFFYRGGSGDNKKGLRMGDSAHASHRPRESANTHNNYTLWMDNHPSFKGWPKRSRSWIATDDRDVAESFGGAALLIISDNAPIGLTGEVDLWNTELKATNEGPGGHMTIEGLNGLTQSLLDLDYRTTWESLSAKMKAYTVEDLQAAADADDDNDWEKDLVSIMKFKKLKNFYELWEYLVTPNIFDGTTTGGKISHQRMEGEIWIEGTVGFIPVASRMSEEDLDRLIEWASEKSEDFFQELERHLNGQDHWSED